MAVWKKSNTFFHHAHDCSWKPWSLKSLILDNPIARETSENWNVHKSYAEDGELVEVVFLDAVKEGYFDPSADGQRVA